MPVTRVVIGTHNHLPLGRSDAEAEELYQRSFKPLLTALYRYPDFPATLHYSGILIEWLEELHPEFLTLLAEMVGRGQVEILGGGYYDPILPLIPTNDKLGQLEKMTTRLRVRFETRPRGCWIAEKVWEPSLASVLRASGIEYTFVDDSQFAMAGITGAGLWEPALTEDQGKLITLLPVSCALSGIVNGGSPRDAVELLRKRAGSVAVIMEDGRGAASSILRDGWLESFIALAAESSSGLEPVTAGQALRLCPPTRRLFVPSSSSAELMSWALPVSRRARYQQMRAASEEEGSGGGYVMGGQFRNFLARYPEAWLLYSKMMNTHVLVNQVRGDKYKKKAAQNELWKGQCHYAYWHGRSGGIYENGLRKAVYKSLIEAEKITRATEIFAPSIISVDYDMDTLTEFLYQGSDLNAYIHSWGGVLFELDFLPASWNYLDTMIDRDAEGRDAGMERADGQYQRKAFIDHFYDPDGSLADFAAGNLPERGDFVVGAYEPRELNRALPELLMSRDGCVTVDGRACPVRVEKRFVFRPRSIDVYYRVTNLDTGVLSTRLGVEINLSLAMRSVDYGRLFLLDEDRKKEFGSETTEIDGVQGLLLRDVRNEVSVTLSSSRPFRIWSLPIETPSVDSSVDFQSHCFVTLWDLALQPGEAWENHMSMGFEKAIASGAP